MTMVHFARHGYLIDKIANLHTLQATNAESLKELILTAAILPWPTPTLLTIERRK